ncbi:hypothetical protein L0F63_002095 [Massospora cicadina]|nr:hypothetical protein L0F63_002095 [Massospora cicadina]
MKLYKLVLIFGFLLAAIFAQSDDTSDSDTSDDESSGDESARFAGSYSFVYYINSNSTAPNTAQPPCKKSKEFKLTIPDDGGSDIKRDVSNEGKDPVYKTSQGTWAIMEVGKGNGFDILKMRLFYDDVDEMIVCWSFKKAGQTLIANVNPRNLTECPTKFVPITDACTPRRSTLVGTCTGGACAEEKLEGATSKPDDSDSASTFVQPLPIFLIFASISTLFV